jgi:plasmid stabilization system protein ParE
VRVVWSALAEQRALEAVDYISHDRPDGAIEWLEALIANVSRLDRMARRGRAVPEIGRPAIREIFHEPYRIIYRIDPSRVVILTLRHWNREWDSADLSTSE